MDTPGTAVKSLSEGINVQVKTLKENLKAYILSLPNMAEGVHQLGKNCCTVSFRTVQANGNILCPSYYLNSTTKEALLELLDKTGIENLNSKLEAIIATGRLKIGDASSIALNPAFVQAVKEMWFGKQ